MEPLSRLFFELTLRGCALLLLAGVAAFALRRAGPAVRHAVWTAAVAGMLLLPLLQLAVPGWTFPVWIDRTAVAPPALEDNSAQVVNVIASVPAAGRTPVSRPVSTSAMLLAAYLSVAAAMLARQAWSSAKLRRLLRRTRPAGVEGLEAAAAAVGYTGRLPEVRQSGEVRVPFTFGVGRPVIVLPEDWPDWSDPKMLSVLAHETAHIARLDWLAGRVAAVNRALNWWNPAAWWLEKHLSALAEEAVDEAALAAVGDVKHYASAVVDFAIAMQGQRLGSMEATAMARSTKVGRRVERILACNGSGSAGVRRSMAVAVALVAVPLIVAAASALPEIRRVGALEAMSPSIQAPAGPSLSQLVAAVRPAEQQSAVQQRTPDAANDRSAELTRRMDLVDKARTGGEWQNAQSETMWLIENFPESPQALVATGMAFFGGSTSLDSPDRQRAADAWRKQARLHSGDAAVLLNAATIVRRVDAWFEAEELILKARKLDPSNRIALSHLASLYVSVLPLAKLPANSSPDAVSFRSRAVAELDSTTDAQLVGLAGEMLTVGNATLRAGQDAQAEAALRDRMRKSNQMAARYLTRALSLEPENHRWQAALKRAQEEPSIARVPEPTPGVKRITVGGPVQMAKLKSQVQPVYPELAKQARIQGIVKFTAILGTDGTVKNLTLLGGHPLFVQAATEAVKQWVYQPTLLNGEPVEVVSNIDVNFTLDESPQAEEQALQDAYRIGGPVSAPVPIFKVEPEFPRGLPGDPAGGAVLLVIVVGADGGVTVVQPLRGDPAFYENAIEAVKKWKFRPAMKEGQPVSVKANVEVNFRKM